MTKEQWDNLKIGDIVEWLQPNVLGNLEDRWMYGDHIIICRRITDGFAEFEGKGLRNNYCSYMHNHRLYGLTKLQEEIVFKSNRLLYL